MLVQLGAWSTDRDNSQVEECGMVLVPGSSEDSERNQGKWEEVKRGQDCQCTHTHRARTPELSVLRGEEGTEHCKYICKVPQHKVYMAGAVRDTFPGAGTDCQAQSQSLISPILPFHVRWRLGKSKIVSFCDGTSTEELIFADYSVAAPVSYSEREKDAPPCYHLFIIHTVTPWLENRTREKSNAKRQHLIAQDRKMQLQRQSKSKMRQNGAARYNALLMDNGRRMVPNVGVVCESQLVEVLSRRPLAGLSPRYRLRQPLAPDSPNRDRYCSAPEETRSSEERLLNTETRPVNNALASSAGGSGRLSRRLPVRYYNKNHASIQDEHFTWQTNRGTGVNEERLKQAAHEILISHGPKLVAQRLAVNRIRVMSLFYPDFKSISGRPQANLSLSR
ncbi:hypothetical protein B0H66DRAFT_619921 [Apodospora peruviana]|uniref:Uncharacterized protein n=1 Tax=Apodospora peruviana TaxID=516989 RepID=A0AAE0ICA9_9PEZI|nr:hypothetical protein B0H66DRAFT_619921 [Apodospora peruviana]